MPRGGLTGRFVPSGRVPRYRWAHHAVNFWRMTVCPYPTVFHRDPHHPTHSTGSFGSLLRPFEPGACGWTPTHFIYVAVTPHARAWLRSARHVPNVPVHAATYPYFGYSPGGLLLPVLIYGDMTPHPHHHTLAVSRSVSDGRLHTLHLFRTLLTHNYGYHTPPLRLVTLRVHWFVITPVCTGLLRAIPTTTLLPVLCCTHVDYTVARTQVIYPHLHTHTLATRTHTAFLPLPPWWFVPVYRFAGERLRFSYARRGHSLPPNWRRCHGCPHTTDVPLQRDV